ncbi:MAG: YbaN family protein [Rhodanobacter sp.]
MKSSDRGQPAEQGGGHDPHPAHPRHTGLVRWLLFIAGGVALLLGLIGLMLPVMPTVPFLLLTAACWSRASPRWHRWLLSLPRLGPAIARWERERSISRRARWMALGLVTLSMAGTIWWFRGHAWLPWLLAALVVLLWLLILRLPVTPDEGGASLQQTRE